MSSLAGLAQEFGCSLLAPSDAEIEGVALSSKFVEPGFLFIAAPGLKNHGLDFLDQAASNGAVAVLTDRPGNYYLPTMLCDDPRAIAGKISARVFETPTSGLFGVTGTNGKTSTAYYLYRLLNAMGESAGLISSASQIVGDQEQVSELTTPEAPRIHQLLAKMRRANQPKAALEVSAQALVRSRVEGLRFQVSGFSNLSRDHLDDFGNMENYLASKERLFTDEYSDMAVINVEDDWGLKLFKRIDIPKVGIGKGLDYELQIMANKLIVQGKQQLEAAVSAGPLMAKNLGLAAVMLLEYGYLPEEIASAISKIDQQVPGRLQLVSDAKPHVYVDYAHTPAGVQAAVKEIGSRYPTLTVVLGASGNRDKGKREEMGLACSGADRIFITDQHPRDEDPSAIRAQLLAAVKTLSAEVFEEADPEKAVIRAIEVTPTDGAVLWCGPGQLRYREIRGEKVPFHALEIARRAVEHD